MYQPDPERGQGSPSDRLSVPVPVNRGMDLLARAFMQVGMGVHQVFVGVRMGVEIPSVPAQQQAQGERGDDACNGKLGQLVHGCWEVFPEQYDGEPEEEERRPVSQPPSGSEQVRPERRGAPASQHQGRDGGDVVGIGGVAKAEQQGDQEYAPGATGERADPLIKGVHGSGRVSDWDSKVKG